MLTAGYVVFIAVILLALITPFVGFDYEWFAKMTAFSFCAFGSALVAFGFFIPNNQLQTTIFLMAGIIILVGHTGILLQILEHLQEK